MDLQFLEGSSKILKDSHHKFNLWTSLDILASIFAMIGLITSTIDYELNYSLDRTYSNCGISDFETNNFRLTTAITTLVSLIFYISRCYQKIQWHHTIRNLQKSKSSEFEYNSFISSLKLEAFIESLILCIFTYPYVEYSVILPVRYDFETLSLCYNLSELLYCVMFFRFYLLLRSLTNYSVYNDEYTRIYCESIKVKPGFTFSLKCLLVTQPAYTVGILGISSLFFTAVACRIFERPMDQFSEQFYSNPLNPLWLIFETISTLGYGDIAPYTYLARVVVVIAWLLGSVLLSIVIALMQTNADLSFNENMVFLKVNGFFHASQVIKASLKYYKSKKNKQKTVDKDYQNLRYSSGNYKKFRLSLQNEEKKQKDTSIQSSIHVAMIHSQIQAISKLLDKLIQQEISIN